MAAYYNELDPYAAQWLRNLIVAGHMAPGDVDERSIEDVRPDDLRGYTQCHFFAGVGAWSYALRIAGWPDDRPVWTGSCPCQPFSAAGKGAGFADERHLWPAFYRLIKECQPTIVFGEQVASKAVDAWIDLVQADVEALDYSFGCVPFPSASVGAPHIRDRAYWVAHANIGTGRQRGADVRGRPNRSNAQSRAGLGGRGLPDRLADPIGPRSQEQRGGWLKSTGSSESRAALGLADADGGNASTEWQQRSGEQRQQPEDGSAVLVGSAGPTNSFWRDADWLYCRDGKWRPVEPGTFPLAHGATSRVGRLRAYGNAINAIQAQIFIEACIESLG